MNVEDCFEAVDGPPDSQYRVHGSHYKIGRFGYAFIWLDNHWKRSTKEKWELENPRPSNGSCHSGRKV